jgi:hypothetical protein
MLRCKNGTHKNKKTGKCVSYNKKESIDSDLIYSGLIFADIYVKENTNITKIAKIAKFKKLTWDYMMEEGEDYRNDLEDEIIRLLKEEKWTKDYTFKFEIDNPPFLDWSGKKKIKPLTLKFKFKNIQYKLKWKKR